MDKLDLIVVGAGPGGYVAAERAAAGGLRVALVEERHLGGVCLNEGCIPSKTLLHSSKVYSLARQGEAYGVQTGTVTFDLPAVQRRKRKIVEGLRGGIAGLMKKHKVEVISGRGRLAGAGVVQVGDRRLEAAHVLLAAGSAPARPPIPGMDLPGVLDSTGILDLETLPVRLVVIGGGVIGCELACFFASVGVPVTVIEMLPEICPTLDPELAATLRGELMRKGIEFHTGARVTAIEAGAVVFETKGEVKRAERDIVLVATGRAVRAADLGLETARVDFDGRGVRVDERGATNVPGIWACGDLTGRGWLAHAASRMGEVVVNNLLGRRDRMRFESVPSVVYTSPEVASVGWTEDEARKLGMETVSAKFPLMANGRFLAETHGARGFAKVVVEKGTRRILGVHLIGGAVSEAIWGAAVALETELRVEDLREVVFPHPTVSEAIRDALFHLPE
jgi:dihydrolipoamide dehydrogenase